MKTYTITQQTIRQLHELGDDKVKAVLKDEFGEVFELPNGVWYKHVEFGHIQFKNKNLGYGINGATKEWRVFDECDIDAYFNERPQDWQPATEGEVKSVIIPHIESKYEAGTKIKSMFSGDIRTVIDDFDFYFEQNKVTCRTPEKEWSMGQSNPCVFDNGKFAEIVENKIPADIQQLIEKHGKAELLKYLK